MPDHRRHKRSRRSRRKTRMCDEKVAYQSQIIAMKAGARQGLNWYRCPYCHRWHLTSQGTSVRGAE